MPRIPDQYLNCAIYLYPSSDAAQAGERVGGSGFLVGVSSHDRGFFYAYAVTNSHVIREGRSPVIRMNTKDGHRAIHTLTEDEWFHHPDGDDLAAAPMALTERHAYAVIPMDVFITPELIKQHEIGPGDDTFMVGRFINHEGLQQNSPSVRFGNIAQMANEPILHERGTRQESFLVESRSIPGYSGSPVFVHVPAFSKRPSQPGLVGATFGPWLLGVDWCHINQELAVRDREGSAVTDSDGHPIYHVQANTGMMGVIPAWKLADLLNDSHFRAGRDAQDDRANAESAEPHITVDEGSGRAPA